MPAEKAQSKRRASTTYSERIQNSTIELDEIFEVLKNRRRRCVLSYLRTEGATNLSDISEQIAAWENDKEISQITSRERKRVYVGLYQCHLPKMDGMDVIDYTKPRGTIKINENFEVVAQYLDEAPARNRTFWNHKVHTLRSFIADYFNTGSEDPLDNSNDSSPAP